jgi:5-methylcytosine-specific restriction protein B
MITNNISLDENLIISSVVDLIDKKFDPYTITFCFEEIALSLINTLICGDRQYNLCTFKMCKLMDDLFRAKFDIHSIDELYVLLKRSRYYLDFFEESKIEIVERIKFFLKTNESDIHFLFIDFDSQTIQVKQIENWKNEKKAIQEMIKNFKCRSSTKDFDTKVELIKALKEMYTNAPEGYQMTMVHLFGIQFAEQLIGESTKKIAIEATGKDSLYVEIGKGIKLSKYVRLIEKNPNDQDVLLKKQDVVNQDSLSGNYKVEFASEENKLLKKNMIIIENNERNYVFTQSDRQERRIGGGGVPNNFQCLDFVWKGSSWKSLMADFTCWYLSLNKLTKEQYIEQKSSFSKQSIFSTTRKTNYLGPFMHGLYINGNHTALHMWWQILDLVNLLDNENKKSTMVRIHYPSAIEPKEIIEMLWKKEIGLFRRYLADLECSSEETRVLIEQVKSLNSIYRKDAPNYYFFLIDRKQDFSNAVSKIKNMSLFQKSETEYLESLKKIIDFRRKLVYDDFYYYK